MVLQPLSEGGARSDAVLKEPNEFAKQGPG